MNRVLTEMVRDVELPKTPVDLERAPYDRTAVTGILDILEIRNPSLRERLLAVDPGAAEAEPPAPAAGIELDGTVLGSGEVTGWLEEHGAQPLGMTTVDTWSLGAGTVTEIALAAAGGPPPGWTRPSSTRPTRRRSPPGSRTRPAPRSCTTPRT